MNEKQPKIRRFSLKDPIFWNLAVDRAIRTACQNTIISVGGAALFDFGLGVIATMIGGGFLLSLMTSIAFGVPEVVDDNPSQ